MNYSGAARLSKSKKSAINMFGRVCIAPYSSNRRARVDLQIVLGSGTKKIKNPLSLRSRGNSNSTEIIAAAPQE